MPQVKWIRLSTDVFYNRKIRQISSLPDGDSIIVMWFRLLCIAGNVNDGGLVYFTKELPYTEEMLSTEFVKPLKTVQMALQIFQQFDMIEIDGNTIRISNWEKYQNIEGMEKIREQNKKRKRKQREREKLALEEKSHVTVTGRHATDKDIEEDIEKEKKNIYIVEISEIISYFNSVTKQRRSTDNKKANEFITARLREGYTVADFKKVIDNKWVDWNGTEYEKFMRPETLFAPSHFEAYLNQAPYVKRKKAF